MVNEKVILNINTQSFPVSILISQSSSCDTNVANDILIENYNKSKFVFDLEVNDGCDDVTLAFLVTDSDGCHSEETIVVENPCKSFSTTIETVENDLDTTVTITANESFSIEWYDINNNHISNNNPLTLPTGSGNRVAKIYSQKECFQSRTISFGQLESLSYAKYINDCKSSPTQIDFNLLIRPVGLHIHSIQVIGTPPQHGTYNIIGNNILVYSQNQYFPSAVVDTFQVEITTYLGVAICDVVFNIAECTGCETIAELEFNYSVSNQNPDNVTYVANRSGIPNSPTNIDSDEIYHSLDNGLTWILGNQIHQCDVFNSMAYFWTECSTPFTNSIDWAIKGVRCGIIGVNSGTLTFKEKNTGNIIQTLSAGAITTIQGESILTSVNNIFNWDGIIAEFDFTFDDGYVLNASLEYQNTFSSSSEPADCTGNSLTKIRAVGSQKLVRFKRVVEFTDDCETIETEYFMSFIQTPNVLSDPFYINGTKI